MDRWVKYIPLQFPLVTRCRNKVHIPDLILQLTGGHNFFWKIRPRAPSCLIRSCAELKPTKATVKQKLQIFHCNTEVYQRFCNLSISQKSLSGDKYRIALSRVLSLRETDLYDRPAFSWCTWPGHHWCSTVLMEKMMKGRGRKFFS